MDRRVRVEDTLPGEAHEVAFSPDDVDARWVEVPGFRDRMLVEALAAPETPGEPLPADRIVDREVDGRS